MHIVFDYARLNQYLTDPAGVPHAEYAQSACLKGV